MLKNCLKIALRSVLNQKLYAAINIAGLAVGIACFILIGLFVQFELSYDGQWTNGERIYRISRDYAATDTIEEAHLDAMPAPAAPMLKQDFPQIEQVARIMCCGVNGASDNGDFFTEWGYADADNALFDIFEFDWISGDPATALTEPFDLVLTRSAARRHFGDADALGKTLLLQWGAPSNRQPRVVKGVIEDLPDNTHLPFDMLGSMQSWLAEDITEQAFNDWSYNAFQTYVLLNEGADIADIQNRSAEFFERHAEDGAGSYMSFTAEPVADIHLRSNRQNIYGYELLEGGSLWLVYTFGAIAVFILLLACINFMNLATARSLQRGKEIGIRKVMGASRSALRLQFLGESLLLVFIAVLAGVAIVELALPSLNAFLARDLTANFLGNPRALAGLVALMLATGMLAGGYPAFYLAQFQPVRVLQGDMTHGAGAALFRRMLVIVQFSISIVLLIATATMYAQMQFARSIDTGYDMSRIVLSGVNVQPQRWEALKREWLAHPEITHVTASSPTPFDLNGPGPAEVRTEAPNSPMYNMDFIMVDYDFFETYGINLRAGRSFSAEIGDRPVANDDGSNITSFIISMQAAQQFGWTPEEAPGQWLDLSIPAGNPEYGWAGNASGYVVGVVDDVYWESVHSPAQPLVYRMYREGQAGVASLKITGNALADTFAWIDQKWKELGPAFPIARTFVDQRFATLYATEQRQAQLLSFFSVLAILISCLGLYGLASFNAEHRTREIGIRKVMGGSVWSIVLLLTNDFSRLVLLSNLIAWPVAYFAINRWLENFAYRIDLTPLIFIGSGLMALCIAWVTVGGTAAKAASAKPVLALRYE